MTNIWAWSTTAATNQNADSGINWSENQSASTVNDSARVMMKRVAEFLDDIGGTVTTGGTGNAQTLAAVSQFAAYADGIIVGFTAGNSNTAAATLNVNSIGAKSIYANGAVLTGGEIAAGGVYVCAYDPALNGSAGGWHLLNPKTTSFSLTGVSTLTVSSASDALKITQTGAGNVLVLEDAASTDSTPWVYDTNGNQIIGHTSALATYLDDETAVGTAGTAKTQQHGVDEDLSAKAITRWTAGAGGPHLILAKSRSGTVGTYTVVQSGDTLGSISFQGADGTDFAKGAVIKAVVSGTPGSNDLPTDIQIQTTPDGSATPVTAVTIASTGKLTTKASTTTSAGLNIPAGTAPTSPADGDNWTDTSGAYWRINGSTRAFNANLWTLSGLTLAQGDILYATGAGAITNLAKGAANTRLRINSGATAPEWVTGDWVLVSTTTPAGGAASEFITFDWTIYSHCFMEHDTLGAAVGLSSHSGGAATTGAGIASARASFSVTGYNGALVQAAPDRFGAHIMITEFKNLTSDSKYVYLATGWGWFYDANVTTFYSQGDTSVGGSTSRANQVYFAYTGSTGSASVGEVRVYGRKRSF